MVDLELRMFARAFHLTTLFGFPIRLDPSWFIIAFLVAWSLAVTLFPQTAPDLSAGLYWTMGIVGALGLFLSILLHELGHAVEARRHGLQMRGITLFIFGGVAEMASEPPNARSEFLVAIGGPLVTVLIAVACYIGAQALSAAGAPSAVTAVVSYLWWINAVVVVFNMIPAFPLDGGRVLRSALWHMKGSLRWATRVTARIGAGFGVAFMALGVVSFLFGSIIGGLWWFLIGLFLRHAARMSYQQLLLRRELEGEPVSRFMTGSVVSVPADTSIRDVVDGIMYQHHYQMYPVVSGESVVGCLGATEVKAVPVEDWQRMRAGDVASRCTDDNTVSPDTDAMDALSLMSRTGRSRLMVADEGRLVGVITLKDLLGFIALKIDLEGGSEASRRMAPRAG